MLTSRLGHVAGAQSERRHPSSDEPTCLTCPRQRGSPSGLRRVSGSTRIRYPLDADALRTSWVGNGDGAGAQSGGETTDEILRTLDGGRRRCNRRGRGHCRSGDDARWRQSHERRDCEPEDSRRFGAEHPLARAAGSGLGAGLDEARRRNGGRPVLRLRRERPAASRPRLERRGDEDGARQEHVSGLQGRPEGPGPELRLRDSLPLPGP